MILEIDSSHRYEKSASLKERGRVVATKQTTGDVLVAARDLLTEQKLTLADLEKVTTVAEGPSFTGLRIGAALANALNFNNQAKPHYSSPPKIFSPKRES